LKKPYSLWKRRLESGRTVVGVAKSSGQSTKTAAEAWAIKYLASGQVASRENVKFGDFAKDFFAWDGPYVSSILMRGRQFGRSHATNNQALVDNYLIPVFGNTRLS